MREEGRDEGGEEASEGTRGWREGPVRADRRLHTPDHDVLLHLTAAVRPWTTFTFTRTPAPAHAHTLVTYKSRDDTHPGAQQILNHMVTAGSLPTETQSVSSDTHNLSRPARTHALSRSRTHSLTHSEAQPGPKALITKALTGSLRENSLVGRQHLRCFFLPTLPSD